MRGILIFFFFARFRHKTDYLIVIHTDKDTITISLSLRKCL